MFRFTSNALNIARYLVIFILIALMFSPAITNLAELLLVITLVSSAELRQRIISTSKQPMVIGAIFFYIIIGIGVLYSIGDHKEAIGMLSGWRKILLLPLAVALFDETKWKFRLVISLITAASIFCLLSYIGVITHIYFPVPEHVLGITLRNHATQGMIFAVAAFSAATLAISLSKLSINFRLALVTTSILMIANIAFITNGRSGYIVLIVCSASIIIGLLISSRKTTVKSISITLVSLAVVSATLATPSSHQRIAQAFNELQHYKAATEVTSMGIRMYFWKNTLEMIAKKPLIGYGTGAFETAYKNQIAGQTGIAATITSDPHNQFLKIATEHGLLGLLAFLAFLASSLRQKASAPYRILGLGVLAAWMATSLANSHFSTFSEGVFIYTLMGAMLANESSPDVNHAKI